MKISDIKNLAPEKLFVVIDGSSYLFRAYYAPNLINLTAPDGAPSGAIYGVLNMLTRLCAELPININNNQQCFSALVFDEKGGSFRNQLYPEYKANRKIAPDNLISQIMPLKEIVVHKGWKMLSIAGVEADDVIATLVRQAQNLGLTSLIVTGDKDFAQLVCDNVFLYDSMREDFLDSAGVEKKFGVRPTQIKDYLTLIGDSSDNIPGVAKVGEKTAVKWLGEYDNLENLINNAHKLSGVVGENLRNSIAQFPLTQKLISLKEDVEIPFNFNELKVGNEDAQQLIKYYSQFGFRKFIAELQKNNPNLKFAETANNPSLPQPSKVGNITDKREQKEAPHYQFETILTFAQLDNWINKITNSPLTAIDTETTGINVRDNELVGISMATSPTSACYIPLTHIYQSTLHPLSEQLPITEVLARLKPIFENPQIKKCGHNLKFDRHFLAKYGINLQGIAHDSMLFVYADNLINSYNLEAAAKYYLGKKGLSYSEVISQSVGDGENKKNMRGVPINLATTYACEDVVYAYELTLIAIDKIKTAPEINKVYLLELQLAQILYLMEKTGITIDVELLNSQSIELIKTCALLTQEIYTLAGEEFNLDSPKQLAEILFNKLKISPKGKTAKGALSTNEEVLEELKNDYPIAVKLLQYRALNKLNNTYAQKIPTMVNPATKRIHTSFTQVGVITGRLASNDPNVQNIPIKTPEGRKIRKAFIARNDGERWQIVSADYSQIELRVMAHFAEDEVMINAFTNGVDIHKRTAAEIFHLHIDEVNEQHRRYAKTINFGLIYGMGAYGLANSLGISNTEAKVFIDRYFTRYPKIFNFMQEIKARAEKFGFVETIYGRKININFGSANTNQQKQAMGRFAINAPIQGSAADIIKIAMVGVDKWINENNLRSTMLLQVHDELVFEVPPSEVELIKNNLAQIMINSAIELKLKVPLEVNVGIGNNWDDAH